MDINPLCAVINDGPHGATTVAASITRAHLAEQNCVTEQDLRISEYLALDLKLFALSDDVANSRLFNFHLRRRFVCTKYFNISLIHA